MMKFYVLMTSLALMAGTTLGYWNGKGTAQSRFADACVDNSFTTVYDRGSEKTRHFHCFELNINNTQAQPTSSEPAKPQLVL